MIIPNQSNIIYNAVMPGGATTPGKLESNTVNTEILSDVITKTLSSDKTFVEPGDTVHNTVTVTNNSATKLIYTFISNYTPKGASFVDGSIKVNGVAQPDKNIITGFFLPDLNPGETITVEYDLKVDTPATENAVTDTSEFQYSVNDPARGAVSFAEDTNTLSLQLISTNISVVKSVDKAFAKKGETLTYTTTITNNGTIDVIDIYFTDKIPEGTTFVENSVSINGINTPYNNPETGFNVANLPPNTSTTAVFQVTIN